MTIKPCKECGAPVSDKAESCPHCGAKQPKKTSMLTWLVVIMLGAGTVMAMVGGNSNDGATQEQTANKPTEEENKAGVLLFMAEQQIRGGAKDASSIEFRNQQLHQKTEEYGAVACGEVNGKNSFGGYTGYKGFVATEKGGNLYMEDSKNHNEFVKIWNKVCAK